MKPVFTDMKNHSADDVVNVAIYKAENGNSFIVDLLDCNGSFIGFEEYENIEKSELVEELNSRYALKLCLTN